MKAELGIEFGRNLAQARRFAGYSQLELADLAGLHVTAISSFERGLRKPGLDPLLRLVGALQITADQLLEGLKPTPKTLPRRLTSLYDEEV